MNCIELGVCPIGGLVRVGGLTFEFDGAGDDVLVGFKFNNLLIFHFISALNLLYQVAFPVIHVQ